MNGVYLIIAALVILGVLGFIAWNQGVPTKEALTPSPDRDKRLMAQGTCPDCGKNELLSGPSGGMSMNVGCNSCLMEFNVHHHFGGILGVDRTGKMTPSRARVFGIEPEEYIQIESGLAGEAR